MRSNDTVTSHPDEVALTDLFSAVAVSTGATSAGSAPAPQALFSEGKVNEGGLGVAFADPDHAGDTVYSVLCVATYDEAKELCGGYIGGDTSRFCIKPSNNSGHKNCCTTIKHKVDRFNIHPQRCYIIKNGVSAFTSPAGYISALEPSQLVALREERRPMMQWLQMFTLQENSRVKAEPEDDQETARKLKLLDKHKTLQTPAKRKTLRQLKHEADEEETFFDTDTVVKFEVPDESSWSSLPTSFQTFFSTLVQGVSDHSTQTFGLARDIRALEKGLDDVGGDLETLDVRLQAVQGQVGNSIRIGEVDFPNVSSGLGDLSERISNNEKELNHLTESLQVSIADFQKSQQRFESVQMNRWLGLTPLVQQIKSVIAATMTNPIDGLARRIEDLESRIPSFDTTSVRTVKKTNVSDNKRESQDSILNSLFSSVPTDSADVLKSEEAMHDDKICKLQEDIRTLMARTSGDGFKLRNFNFQSMEELRVWIKEHVTGHRFGLFVDGVSIWEYYRHGHFSMPEVLASMRDTTRVGFATVQEARVATSFENVLPAVLGKGTDASKSLPGLPNVKAWDAGDGNNGLRFLLNDYNTNVYTQLADQIQNAFDDFTSPARSLALECLQRSIQFVNEISNYMTRFHAELISSGSFSPDQCWQLVCRCVKRCFQDMGSTRVIAKDGRLVNDPLGTATTYIWGTLRTHSIMQEYLKYNFEDHPAFASVITRFVTNNNYQSSLKGLTDRLEKQEKGLSALSKRVDTLYNRVSVLEKKE